jgi:hypothetical protein
MFIGKAVVRIIFQSKWRDFSNLKGERQKDKGKRIKEKG